MIRIVICTHGGLADELVRTSAMICGPADGVRAVCLGSGRSAEDFRSEVKTAVDECGDDPVVFLTDMFGGSAFMAAAPYADGVRRILVAGANLPLMLEIVLGRDSKTWEEIRASLIGDLSRFVRPLPGGNK
jgi:mannose/fructose/sorbose-specific phosphotransferase system IIA component